MSNWADIADHYRVERGALRADLAQRDARIAALEKALGEAPRGPPEPSKTSSEFWLWAMKWAADYDRWFDRTRALLSGAKSLAMLAKEGE
jgi:hypothetical protein